MEGNYIPPDESGMSDVNLNHYANHVCCVMCHTSVPFEQAKSLDKLPDSERGLVLLSGVQTEYDGWVCLTCLTALCGGKRKLTGYLNSFAHLESYGEFVQAFVRAYIGSVIVCNLFQSTAILPAVAGAFIFAMCPWDLLLETIIGIFSFPPLLLTVLFIPWTVIVYFGTNPFSFMRLLDDPSQYFPWTTFTFFHDNYIEAVFIAMGIVGVLYAFAYLSTDYLTNIDIDELPPE
jgi:hypothetical protein